METVVTAEPVQEALPPARTESVSDPLVVAVGIFGGFLLLALVNAVAIAVSVPRPTAGMGLRVLHHVFDAGETLGLGAAVATTAGVFVRFVRLPRWAVGTVLFALGVLLTDLVIGEYLYLQAEHGKAGGIAPVIFINYLCLLGGAFATAPSLAAFFGARPKLRLVPVVLATATLVADHIPLRDDYFGIHGLAAIGAVLLAAPALAAPLLRVARALARSLPGRGVLGAVLLFSLLGLVVPPSNAVRFELFRQPVAVAPWALATVLWRLPALHAPVALAPSPWVTDRSAAPDVPITTPPPLPHDAIVVLMTIDALRADVVNGATHDARFPTFATLKREGVTFTQASAAGTQTPVSISTMFSGLYFSQQRWEDYGNGPDRYPYPATEHFATVPELLTAHGVDTAEESGFVFLAGGFGVTRGFREERPFGQTRAAAPGSVLVGAMLQRLKHTTDGPLFLYSHLAEPHAPYWVGPGPTPYDHYLSAVAEADKQVGRVLEFLREHYGDHWVLIVSADHGEAFGDHQTFEHAKTLYEELLHVPLLVMSPRFSPRKVEERVGLVDLGPTLLDLFQAPTPATFNGQSLVPLLMGKDVVFTRPLLAEGRLRTSLTEQDGFKVIEDPRRKVVEAYDLVADPGETRNVFDTEPGRSDAALAKLRAFFDARRLRDGGYEAPYKP